VRDRWCAGTFTRSKTRTFISRTRVEPNGPVDSLLSTRLGSATLHKTTANAVRQPRDEEPTASTKVKPVVVCAAIMRRRPVFGNFVLAV